MAMRRLCKEGIAALRHQSKSIEELGSELQRAFSSLPEDLLDAARKAKYPSRRHAIARDLSTPKSDPAAAQAAKTTATVEAMKEGGKIASAWMFPWERRQLEGSGTKLRTWEKAYWGVFVVAISVFLFNRASEWKSKEPEAVDDTKDQRKEERARMVLAGASTLVPWGEEDVFEDMSPEEIQEYVEKTTGASSKDPFEGMDPEAIDAWVAKHGMEQQPQ